MLTHSNLKLKGNLVSQWVILGNFCDLLRVYELYENSKYMYRRGSIKHDAEDRGQDLL